MAAKSKKNVGKTISKRKTAKKNKNRGRATAESSDVGQAGELLNMDQAIKLLRTTRPTFYRWLRSGKIKGMKVGRQWRFERQEIKRFLKGEEPRIELRANISPLIKTLSKRAKQLGAEEISLPEETKVQQAVKLMIRLGITMGASDIHLAPHITAEEQQKIAVLRYRIDGVLYPTAEIDIRLLPAIIEQWKILAACDLHETKPQDGRIRFEGADKSRVFDIRACFLRTWQGKALTAHILRGPIEPNILDRIDFASGDKEKRLRWIDAPNGLIIFTGPTGSGKTTALYACLERVANPKLKVMTVEDPVEVAFPWIVQVQVNEREGTTFSSAMRAIWRSDPDVIMVGEIRDAETLRMTQTAALTGHLVLTQLHADEAAKALVRMVELGIEPFIVGDSTSIIVAQRLVRLVCPDCSKGERVPTQLLARAEKLARTGGLNWDALAKKFRKPVGCSKCKQIGYQGRNVIAEMLEVTPEISEALRRGASVEELRTIAVGQGMTTMAADGIQKAADGKTTLDEVMRVLAG